MKKQILLIVSFFIMANLSAGTALGLKGGLQSSKIFDSNPASDVYSPTLRTNLGLVCNFGYSKAVSFQMELDYSRKGSKLASGNKLTYGYLELPLLLKVAGGSEKFKVFGLAGPYVAAPLKEESIIGDNKTVIAGTDNGIDTNPVIEKMDVGFQLGGGITYKMGPGRLLVEIKYCQGFGERFVPDSYNTNALQLNVGYLFTFGE